MIGMITRRTGNAEANVEDKDEPSGAHNWASTDSTFHRDQPDQRLLRDPEAEIGS